MDFSGTSTEEQPPVPDSPFAQGLAFIHGVWRSFTVPVWHLGSNLKCQFAQIVCRANTCIMKHVNCLPFACVAASTTRTALVIVPARCQCIERHDASTGSLKRLREWLQFQHLARWSQVWRKIPRSGPDRIHTPGNFENDVGCFNA